MSRRPPEPALTLRSLLDRCGVRWAVVGRRRAMIDEFMRFSVVGTTNTAINFITFLVLAATVFVGAELEANIVAAVVTWTSAYLMSRYWAFRHRPRSRKRRQYPLFFMVNIAGLAIELAVMGGAKYGLGLTGLLPLTIAKATGIGIGTIFRFWTYRTFVFAARRVPRIAPDPIAPDPRAPRTPPPDPEIAEPAVSVVGR